MGSKQLLDAVNETLKRVNVIAGNAGLLTSLTNSPLQHNIDIAVQVINEGQDELYTTVNRELPNQGGESTITLATGTREYSLQSNLITLLWPMIDRTNTQYLYEWEGTYEDFLLIDPQQLYTGLPIWGMISPITGMLRIDRAPDAPSNGRVYTYEYKKNMVLVNATDPFTFSDETFRSMVPAWAQLYKREMRNEFDQALYTQAIGRASRTVTQDGGKIHYDPRG